VKHPTADVSQDAQIPESASIWHYAQVREQVVMGENCVVGRGAYIGPGVKMGDNCKVQNYALVYEPAQLADGVFIGPAAVLTNDEYPRAITRDGKLKSGHDWVAVGVIVKHGASIGARSVCVAPVVIGAWTLIAAGSVVTHDVPDFALVAGVPARRIGWVGKAGVPLEKVEDNKYRCPRTGEIYLQTGTDTLAEGTR
jgi:UDP-2-acetamido-3-amino-2,3-dideoxy-glucuronate N-acetyltransferase